MSLTLAAVIFAVLQQPIPVTVPMREEPYHRPVFENRYVAVYDVVLPIDAVMRYHEHPTNHLAVVIDSGRMRNEVLGYPPKINPTGARGTIVYLPAGPPHRQTNIGLTTVHFTAVEVLGRLEAEGEATTTRPLSKGAEQRAAPGGGAGCRVVLEQTDVRAWRCRLGPRQAAPPRQGSAPFLRVPISPGILEPPSQAGASRQDTLRPGTAVWHDNADSASVRNAGTAGLEFVDLEWK